MGGKILIISVYVDDIVLAGNSSRQIDKVKRAISKKFEIKDLEELKYFLSVKIVTTTRMEQYGLDFQCLIIKMEQLILVCSTRGIARRILLVIQMQIGKEIVTITSQPLDIVSKLVEQ